MNKTAVIAVVALFVAVAAYGAYTLMKPSGVSAPLHSANGETSVLTIRLTANGFVPAESTIKAGETVTFVTDLGKQFWPASNLHPTHLLYPEFDPKQPIAPNASWSFTFTKAGSWKFHDHLAPYYTGTINVSE